jgi:hypothetical protein
MIMNDELGRMLKEAIVAFFTILSQLLPRRTEEATRFLGL